MKTAIIIPSRYGSERFPGKPLVPIKGISLIERVWRLAAAVPAVDILAVATDDERIAEHVNAFGGRAIMTRPECRNGSERVYEACSQLSEQPDVIVNLQGDAVLTPPWVIEGLCSVFKEKPGTQCATPAVRVSAEQRVRTEKLLSKGIISGTHVVCDGDMNALYFSRYPLPFQRKISETLPTYRHIGMYAYTPDMLKTYMSLKECELEKVEGLEQLRLLYHGIKMQVVEVDYRGRSHCGIDTEEDKKYAEEIIEREGELV